MDFPKARIRKYSIVILCIMAFSGILWLSIRSIPVSRSYGVRAEFATLPADDQELEQWLRKQPGVVSRTVHTARDGHAVCIIWIMTQKISGYPHPPDLQRAWQQIGYLDRRTVDWNWQSE